MSVECQKCARKCELFLCVQCMLDLRQMLTDMPWWLDRLAETSVGQARLGDPGGRRGHKAGLERYADPKPAVDGDGTEGDRRLERDLTDRKLRARLLAQGGVNAHASDLFDEVQNMLGSWVRDVCERRGVDVPHIATASRMAMWLKQHVSSLASAECALETYTDVKHAHEQMVRAVNRPPPPKTCGPCPTPGEHTDKGFVMSDTRSKCGTRLEARENQSEVVCPVCKQAHDVEALTTRLTNDMHYMSFTIRQLLDVVLPRGDEHIPRRTLYDWVAKNKLEASGYEEDGTPKYLLADVRQLRTQHARKSA